MSTKRARLPFLGLAVILVVAVTLSLTLPAAAQWTGNWVSSFQVMNIGDDTATVRVLYYGEDGSMVTDDDYTVAQGSAINVYQPSVPGLPSGFKGSVVVEASQPIASIGSEMVTYADGSIGNSQYSGLGQADIATRFYLPSVNKLFGAGQWSSRITIQNAEASAVTATVTYRNANGTVRSTEEVSLPGNGSVTLLQANNTKLPAGWLGAAIVDASGNVAVIVDVMSADGRLETYNGFSSGATTAYLPTLLIGFGANKWDSSFQVLNVGGSSATVTMTYYTAGVATPAKVATATLPPYQSLNRHQPTVDSDLGRSWIGSVVIEATQPIVAVGTQSSGAAGTRLASSYNGAATGTTQVVLPTILCHFGGSQFVTSFQIMNVGTSAASVTVEYFAPGNPTPVKTVRYDGSAGNQPKIPRFLAVNRYQPNDDAGLGKGWQGSVRVDSDQPVVVLGSQNGLARKGDAVGQYNGVVVTK